MLVSYDVALDAERAEIYADDVFHELRKMFNLHLAVAEKTHVINNEIATIDIHYQISGTAWNVDSFEELAKYHPPDGFGQFINRSLPSFYLRSDFIPRTDLNQRAIYSLEYNLARTNLGYLWHFLLSVGYQVGYNDEGHVNVGLNELLNHSGPITPSAHKTSQVTISSLERQLARKTALWMSLNRSSPAYSDLRKERAAITDLNAETRRIDLIYDLTRRVDDIIVTLNVAKQTADPILIYIVTGFSATSVAFIVLLVFVRTHRKRSGKVE